MSGTYSITLSGTLYTVEYFDVVGAISWTPPTAVVSYDRLIVAGGGGGAEQGNGGGAGGAGGLLWDTGIGCLPGVPITGTVGAGGAGGTSGSPAPGTNGGNSTFDGVTATGGGKGGAGSSGTSANNGGAGGSGGGGSGAISSGAAQSSGGAGTGGQGNNGAGGSGSGTTTLRCGGGGGGKGSAGVAGTSAPKAGDGGTGFDATALLGTGVGESGWFASGGGAGVNNSNPATRGLASPGGGGDGGHATIAGAAGLAGTGGGGGGGGGNTGGTTGDGGAGGSGFVAVRYILTAPGDPTSLVAAPVSSSEVSLSWSAPVSTGSGLDHYEVRIDGGAEVTATSPHAFTGLTPSTIYTVEVRSVGPGGASSWVSEVVTTDAAVDSAGYYRVSLTLGSHTWGVEKGQAAAYGPSLPLSLGWEIADSVEFFPSQADLQTLSFSVRVPDAADLVDVVKGSLVSMRMYVDPDPAADPWQTFDGIVTQLEGETLPSLDPAADENARDFRMTVFAADDNARLASMFVGYGGGDWPIESISDRIDRICTEAGITRSNGVAGGPFGTGMAGWLPARPAGSPISALNAIQQALRDAADDYDSEPPDEFYGRYVYEYNHAATDDLDATTLYINVFRRRMYTGFSTIDLDGGLVHSRGARWTKQPGPSQASWVVVDGTTFGTPSGVPYVRNTGLLDYFGDPPGSETNYSAAERDNLGESLLPDGSTALDGWATRVLRYAAYVNPAPVALLASQAPPTQPKAIVVAPVAEELRVNDEDYLAGTLTGARMTIIPGGRFYVDVRLRSELLPGTELPA